MPSAHVLGVLCYIEPSIVFKAKVAHHVRICGIDLDIMESKPEALQSLYRSPAYKKNQLVLCKNYVLQW